jgi:hypothetical protein
MKETHYDGTRTGRNFALDRQTEPLVLDSEISGLENLHAYLKYGNHVARFSFPVLEIPPSKPKFIDRLIDDYIVREPRNQPEEAKNECPVGATTKLPLNDVSVPIASVKPMKEEQEPGQAQLSFGPGI